MYGHIAWHRAAIVGSLESLDILWSWGMEAEPNPRELLLAQSEEGLNALHMVTKENHVVLLQALWFWAEQVQQNTNKLKKKLFLAKDKYGNTAWHPVASFGRLETLMILYNSVTDAELNLEELLLAQLLLAQFRVSQKFFPGIFF